MDDNWLLWIARLQFYVSVFCCISFENTNDLIKCYVVSIKKYGCVSVLLFIFVKVRMI